MYKTATEAVALVKALKREVDGVKDVEIVVCPPFTALAAVSTVVQNGNIKLGAQNVHWEKEGAFTGEIAAPMLKELFVRYAIVGHSERRQLFSETDVGVNKRAKAALASEIRPIVCVGETLAQREKGQTKTVVREQVTGSLAGLSKDDMLETVVAYEPVWAIGTGRTPTNEDIAKMHRHIRRVLVARFGDAGRRIDILYGGSVNPKNAKEILAQSEVGGALVGGASLKAADFLTIIAAAPA